MSSNLVTLNTSDGDMTVAVYRPEEEPVGAVIVIPEAYGLNDHIKSIAAKFASEQAMIGIGLDIFHRSDAGTASYTDFKAVMKLYKGLDDDGLLVDIDAALEHLADLGMPAERTGIVGYCFGGRVAFLAGARRTLGAAVGYYGGGLARQGAFPAFPPLIDEVATLKTPFLGLFGGKDKTIPPDEVDELRQALDESAPVEHKVISYPEADHAFNCDERPSYNAEAAAAAGEETSAWFARHLGSR